jgi:nicotinate-nucleotide pyrophosphorylase (carboxylating)
MTATSRLYKESPEVKPGELKRLEEAAIRLALEEDLGSGDITTLAVIPENVRVRAEIIFKQAGVLAGIPVFRRVFESIDPSVEVTPLLDEGSYVDKIPTVVAVLEGPARAILTGERTALNFLQRLSAVATRARSFAQLASANSTKILDTRKTTPGLRVFEKYAAGIGGATNHRFGLFDAILIKDNHVRLAGGVARAVRLAREKQPNIKVEVETTTLDEVREALSENPDVILLDNMRPEQIREAIQIISGKCSVEVSGGVNFENIAGYLIPGVDAISIGALTHSAGSIDISLEIEA